jgi:hypothetical protein
MSAGRSSPIRSGYVTVLPSASQAEPEGVLVFSLVQNGTTVTETGISAMCAHTSLRLFSQITASENVGNGAPGTTRTRDLLIRSQSSYILLRKTNTAKPAKIAKVLE